MGYGVVPAILMTVMMMMKVAAAAAAVAPIAGFLDTSVELDQLKRSQPTAQSKGDSLKQNPARFKLKQVTDQH